MNRGTVILLIIILVLYIILKERRSQAAKVYYVKKLPGNYNAQTIPPIGVFISESERGNAALLNHELAHWQQYQKKGLLLFGFNFLKENIIKGYDLNAYEIAARSNESDYCKINYTECVRNGTAVTVYNPKFRT